MPVTPDTPAATGWRWKPVDIAVIVVAFVIWWPLGVAAIAWKLWNDRQPAPMDLGEALQAGFGWLQGAIDRLWGAATAPAAAVAPMAPTGNAAFDAHVREELARLDGERRKLEEEVAAFRAFLAAERSGDRDVYERFRRSRGPGRD